MALLDISLVTRALVTLLDKGINGSTRWGGAPPPFTVLPAPPDQITTQSLGLYLIHVTEDPHYKSQPPAGTGAPPVRFTPMALQLVYQVTAHSPGDADHGTETYNEQNLLGLAMKLLHDYPSISDDTKVVDQTGTAVDVFPADLKGQGNRIRISLLPFTQSEAMSLWTGGQQLAPRLSVYYHVAVVMLQPDKLQASAQRVLRYGVDVLVGGPPVIEGSSSTLQYAFPGDPGAPRTIDVSPAEAPVGDPVAGVVTFTGANLRGAATSLQLQGLQWKDVVDTGWPVTATEGSATVALQETAAGHTVVPGVYSARLLVRRQVSQADGSFRFFDQLSNVTPFVILPRIDSISAPVGVITVTGFVFQDADLRPDAVQVQVGDQPLAPAKGAAPGPGEFKVTSPTQLTLQLPAGFRSGPAALTVVVRGAASPPTWIVVP